MPKQLLSHPQKKKKSLKSGRPFLTILFLSFTIVILAIAVRLFNSHTAVPKNNVPIHAPHYSTQLSDDLTVPSTSPETLGIKNHKKGSAPTAVPTATPVPTLTPTPTPVPATPTTAPSAPTPTPVPAATANQYGIAAGGYLIHLDQNDLNDYFSRLKELGVGWVRWDFDWGVIQAGGPTSFDWSGTDRVVDTANAYGIKTLGIIDATPTWARRSECNTSDTCAPADPAVFANFAAQTVQRYKSKGVHTWEIWNEPNYHLFWKPLPNVNEYAALLKPTYTAIKNADPDSVVLTGGLASAGDEDNNIAPITFVNTLYTTDAADSFDGIAVHPYTFPALPSVVAWWNRWQQIVPIHQTMLLHGDSYKRIWITEFGAPTDGPGTAHDTTQTSNFNYGTDYMTENAQGQILSNALDQMSAMQAFMGPFFWYSLRDNSNNTNDPENFFGLLRYDNSKKPAYIIYQSAIQGIR